MKYKISSFTGQTVQFNQDDFTNVQNNLIDLYPKCKADQYAAAFRLAWDLGHSDGIDAVASHLDDIMHVVSVGD